MVQALAGTCREIQGGFKMIVCDRCGKNPGRLFAYGDAINESYNYADLCYECTKEINELLWRYRQGINWKQRRQSDV